MEIRNALVLAVIALVAFATVICGFAKIDFEAKPSVTFGEERQQIVEQAQLWYIRPIARNGGGMSFEAIDFQKLNLPCEPGCLAWEGKSGRYSIETRKGNSFVLSALPTGGSAEVDTIFFDSLPD